MRKLTAVALLALLIAPALSACTKTVDEMSYSEVKEYAAEMHKKCLAQGVKDGPEMQLCINQEARADQSRRIRQRQVGEAMAVAGANIQRNAAMNRPINCTSNGYGRTVYTSCY